MLFNVAQLLREPTGAERTYRIDADVPAVTDEAAPSHAAGAVRLVRTHRGLIAYASLDAVARDLCSRCLGPTESPVHVEVAAEFLPTADVSTGAPLVVPEEDGIFTIDDHHHLDLTEAVRQELVVSLPMQPLCRPDCAGLCPECGTDRNRRSCNCDRTAPDPRWAALSSVTIGDNARQ